MIRNEGYRALINVLGTAGTVVFLRQFESGDGNYTVERHKTMAANSVDTIANRIRKRNESQQ